MKKMTMNELKNLYNNDTREVSISLEEDQLSMLAEVVITLASYRPELTYDELIWQSLPLVLDISIVAEEENAAKQLLTLFRESKTSVTNNLTPSSARALMARLHV